MLHKDIAAIYNQKIQIILETHVELVRSNAHVILRVQIRP